ncbi:glycoside hydrolase family 3 C-terminal domain-containing protein [Sphingomonas sp. GC_Shp_3]|uniref:beta-glucosidase n=1 Tax=Sphingomonas sp. GC_Shp_3 TaxID=2937383 RepID=UPI00226A7F27|nr:glycoside hydrolase family 3 C-terminal domain-containing protein [Sphingomonas sp. GC_Shp_3]
MKSVALATLLAALLASGAASAQPQQSTGTTAPRPWMNAKLSPEVRTKLLLAAMTQEEKLSILSGWFGSDLPGYKVDPLARYASAGFVPGVPRLGIPPQWQTDAGAGVATQNAFRDKPLERTTLPSGLAIASTWNPALAEQGGAMIGAEARASGLNVMLAGGVDLVREPRNGRNFEYAGEDPLLAGTIAGAGARGVESAHIIGQVKHYAMNDQETGRNIVNAVIDRSAARMSDLLGFEIALEKSHAGSVMCAYNKVDGDFSCENDWLLNTVLKRDWHFPGYVMSDWGATHSTVKAANAGEDQETGYKRAEDFYFGPKLAAAIAAGDVPQARLDDMAGRVLRTMFAKGVIDFPVGLAPIDFAAHAEVARKVAGEGIVLLKNRGDVLPLSAHARRIAVIGGHADAGVLSGGGSAQVYPRGGNAVPGVEPTSWPGPVVYLPSSPLKALRRNLPGATVGFDGGQDPAAAASLAAASDVAIVFVTQWAAESRDVSISLPDGQDALIEAVARANPNTIVVLETGGPVLMPWLDRVAAAVEAWYPGTDGGDVIADVLSGRINPSGRMPVSIPRSVDQLPRPKLDGEGVQEHTPFDVVYSEGAAVGYRWYAAHKLEPTLPFGHGLSYTSFAYSNLRAVLAGQALQVSFTVRNTGKRAGADVPQVYVGPADGHWEAPRRLGAFDKITLAPGVARTVTVTVDPRLLSMFDESKGAWSQRAGAYTVWLGRSARDLPMSTSLRLPERTLPAGADFTSAR